MAHEPATCKPATFSAPGGRRSCTTQNPKSLAGIRAMMARVRPENGQVLAIRHHPNKFQDGPNPR